MWLYRCNSYLERKGVKLQSSMPVAHLSLVILTAQVTLPTSLYCSSASSSLGEDGTK